MTDIEEFGKDFSWVESARNYYQVYRIIIFFGYSKPAFNMLCTSLEKFLKIYIALRDGIDVGKLKKYQHNLKRLFKKSRLNNDSYRVIKITCYKTNYNRIRYEFDFVTNDINLVHRELEKELKSLAREIMILLNKKHESQARLSWDFVPGQDRRYKAYCLSRALKGRDMQLRFDSV